MKIKLLCLALILLLFPLYVPAAAVNTANVNVASGSLYQDFELFEVKSSGLPSTVIVTYESQEGHVGTLGRGWTHTFDLHIHRNGDGSIVQNDIYGNQYLFLFDDGKYVRPEDDQSILKKQKNGGYTIERENLTYHYDKDWQITSIVDPYGVKATFSFKDDKVLKVTTSEEKTITFSYGSDGKLMQITDQTGKTYSFKYGDDGYISSIIYPDNATWRFTYDNNGFMLTKTKPEGTLVTYHYDEHHRCIGSITEGGKSYTYTYPAYDNYERVRTTSSSVDGEVFSKTYDTHTGNVLQKVDPKGGLTTYTYDNAGNTTSETNPAGQTTTYTYDNKNRMTSMQDPYGNIVTYKYDERGNLIEVTDSVQGTVRNEYNAKGQMTKTIGPDGKTVTYVYDAEGNLKSMIGPDGQKVQLPQQD